MNLIIKLLLILKDILMFRPTNYIKINNISLNRFPVTYSKKIVKIKTNKIIKPYQYPFKRERTRSLIFAKILKRAIAKGKITWEILK